MHMHKNILQWHMDMDIQVQENNLWIQLVFQDLMPMVLRDSISKC